MKKSITTVAILASGFLFSAVLTTSCTQKKGEKQEQNKNDEDDEDDHDESKEQEQKAKSDSTTTVYACSMHPEVTGKEGEKCSKCGMKLEAVKGKD